MKTRKTGVGRRLKRLRLARSYTQVAVAEDLGVAPNTVSSWEREARPMSVDWLFTLADYYDVPVTALVGDGKGTDPCE